MRSRRVLGIAAAVIALALGACASVHNLPLNEPAADPVAAIADTARLRDAGAAGAKGGAGIAAGRGAALADGGAVVGLAFSGGGTRAAAFAQGVLEEMKKTPPGRGRAGSLLDRVAIVSGVSGGSIIAAYYGLKGPAATDDFRQRFLAQDVMAQLNTRISLVNLNRALGGGANTDDRMRDWLNANLYDNATLGDVLARGRPVLLINATDVYSRTPFVFAPGPFAALCSDFAGYPLAAAVAASSAVPGAFAPVVLKTYPEECKTPLPAWVEKAAADTSGSPQVHAFAKSLALARSGKVKYIKLFDGGMVDNYGLSGVTIARAAMGAPYAPLQPQEAINLRRLLFIIVDAGRGPSGDWNQTVEGPSGKELITAVLDTIIDANSQASYAAFEATMQNWRNDIIRWRCGLSGAEVARLRGGRRGPNCRDLKIVVTRVDFDQLAPDRAARLNQIPTSLTLPADSVDALVRAGADALKANAAYQQFLKEL